LSGAQIVLQEHEQAANRGFTCSDLSHAGKALYLGFAGTRRFYKAFRKWSGTHPGHYRRLISGGG
jgi:hypothetical protein